MVAQYAAFFPMSRAMDEATRNFFDQHLEQVLAAMPAEVHRLLDEVPLFVEDYPSRDAMQKLGVRHRSQLCGLYTGIPLTERSINHSGVLSDVVQIFREGILSMATDRRGKVDEVELRRQIRITILHELGHHHGLTEDDLEELGY
jgi:predicted Zn-dependent protease with MMP-like domain